MGMPRSVGTPTLALLGNCSIFVGVLMLLSYIIVCVMKNKKKYLSIWACFIFCLLFIKMTWADENEWLITSKPLNNTSSLSISQDFGDFAIICNRQMYFMTLRTYNDVEPMTQKLYESNITLSIDRNNFILFSQLLNISKKRIIWNLGSVSYNKIKGEGKATGTISEYKTLFQQMLDAKKSITVEATDADNQKHSVTFGVKGLRDGLLEMNQRCGSDFQYYSGIPIQGVQ